MVLGFLGKLFSIFELFKIDNNVFLVELWKLIESICRIVSIVFNYSGSYYMLVVFFIINLIEFFLFGNNW